MGKAFVLGLLIGLAFALWAYLNRTKIIEKLIEGREYERKLVRSAKAELYSLTDEIGKGLHAIEAIPGKLKIAIGKIL